MNRLLGMMGLLTGLAGLVQAAPALEVSAHGVDGCILLENRGTRVILCPEVGGRVLEYSLDGKHALPVKNPRDGKPLISGRFDIGPELTTPKRPVLWSGAWKGEITGPRSARLTSSTCPNTGVRLVRDFELAAESSELVCRQTIENRSDKTVSYCHWSRTFAQGKGIVLIPLAGKSKYPNQYVMYEEGHVINARPEDEKIRVREGFLEILGAPRKPKLGMDTTAGWTAYLMPNDLAFVKRFPVYPERVYSEAAGLTYSVWYPSNWDVVELEPIGPRERLAPGESASFTETWSLAKWEFPGEGEQVDLGKIRKAFGKK